MFNIAKGIAQSAERFRLNSLAFNLNALPYAPCSMLNFLQFGAQIAEPGHFCSETRRGPRSTSAYSSEYQNIADPAA